MGNEKEEVMEQTTFENGDEFLEASLNAEGVEVITDVEVDEEEGEE